MMSGPYERITESNAAVTRSAKNEDFDILDFLFALVSLFSSINPIIQTFYAFLPIVYRTNNMCYDYPVIASVDTAPDSLPAPLLVPLVPPFYLYS